MSPVGVADMLALPVLSKQRYHIFNSQTRLEPLLEGPDPNTTKTLAQNPELKPSTKPPLVSKLMLETPHSLIFLSMLMSWQRFSLV